MKFTSCVGLCSAAPAFAEVKATVLVGAHDAEEKYALLQNLQRNNLMVLGSCEEGYYVSHRSKYQEGKCVKCYVHNCAACNSRGSCSACKEGYFSGYRGECVRRSDNCASFHSGGFCSSCEEGYFGGRNDQEGLCVKCTVDNCAACSSDGSCRSCQEGYFRGRKQQKGQCVKGSYFLKSGKCIKGDFKTLKTIGTGAHTIRATVKMPKDMPTVDARQWILNLGQNGDGANHWLWSPTNVHKAGNLQFGRWNGGQIKDVTNDQMIKAASLTTTFDGNIYSFYIDGMLKKTTVIDPPLNILTDDLRVGLQPAGWKIDPLEVDFTGCVTKVEVWDSALTPEKVAQEE